MGGAGEAAPDHLQRSGTGRGTGLHKRSKETRVTASGDHEPWRRGAGALRSPEGGLHPEGEEGGPKGLGGGSRDPLNPKDVFIAVKTTKKYHRSRLTLLLQTWVSQAKEQVKKKKQPPTKSALPIS